MSDEQVLQRVKLRPNGQQGFVVRGRLTHYSRAEVLAVLETCKANRMKPEFDGTYPDASKVAGHKNPPPPGSSQ